jgi:hypothetical protein
VAKAMMDDILLWGDDLEFKAEELMRRVMEAIREIEPGERYVKIRAEVAFSVKTVEIIFDTRTGEFSAFDLDTGERLSWGTDVPVYQS